MSEDKNELPKHFCVFLLFKFSREKFIHSYWQEKSLRYEKIPTFQLICIHFLIAIWDLPSERHFVSIELKMTIQLCLKWCTILTYIKCSLRTVWNLWRKEITNMIHLLFWKKNKRITYPNIVSRWHLNGCTVATHQNSSGWGDLSFHIWLTVSFYSWAYLLFSPYLYVLIVGYFFALVF